MSENARRTGKRPAASSEAGIALVLAIMSLMLLTFLGLTLATTTSTELQIATNYRWSQQALYNAEAGIEATKVIIGSIPGASLAPILPASRGTTTWLPTDPVSSITPPAPPAVVASGTLDPWGNPLRNFENQGCDNRNGNVGYGVILSDAAPLVGSNHPLGQTGPFQYLTTVLGQRLNGAVTVWIRRGTRILATGAFQDDPSDLAAVVTAEGVAPYTEGNVATAFAQANRATRVLEASILLAPGGATPCDAYRAQAGNGVSGSGFAVCGLARLDCTGGTGGKEADLLGPALGDSARAAGGNLAVGSGTAGSMGSLQDPANPGQCVQ